MTSDDDHTSKALFTSPTLDVDLRYICWSQDGCKAGPTVELKVQEIPERKLLGPAVGADFDLEEGQVVVFVLRQVEKWEYANSEHQEVAEPKPERAESLGISLDKLIDASSRLRPKQNPMMSRVSNIMVLSC